ncbi:M16 family metallopeptidase [Ilumatobacter coccineus]|nr:M16 family metallopeptidase [Ilumatobacter coccineus]
MLARRSRSSRSISVRALGVLLASSVGVAACVSSADDVDSESSDSTPTSEVADAPDVTTDTDPEPVSTDPAPTTSDPVAEQGDTPTFETEPPDASSLPSLTDGDDDTVSGMLDNGLRYLIRENDNPGSKVELRLVIDAGSGLEDDDQVGGAHFLEHMLFNGTEQFPKNDLVDVLRSFGAGFGADINAYTSFDETVYTLTVPTGDPSVVSTGLDVLEQWLSAATIAEDDVIAERGVVLDEWRVRDQTSSGRLFDEIADFFLAGTAYDGHTPIGGGEAIETTEAAELRRFYDDWYRPDNATVIVVGDIDVDDMEQQVVERFADEVDRGSSPERVTLEVPPATEARARVASDTDLAEGYAFVTLPIAPTEAPSIEAEAQAELYRVMAFRILATRLNNDALRGEAPFDSAEVASSEFVREMIAPEIFVTVDGENVAAAVQAIVDEYERVRRFGFAPEEVERAAGTFRSDAQTTYDGRNSRQDASYADEYVDFSLTGDPYVTAQREYDFINAAMDGATPENLTHVFVEVLDAAGPHIFAAVPSGELDDTATAEELVAIAESVGERDLEPPATSAAIGDDLMERPDPVEESERFQLADDPFPNFIDPTVVRFDNGVTVSFNPNAIVEGQVYLEGRSPGGLAALSDADVPNGDALSGVVGNSGVGDFDRVAIDEFLDKKDLTLYPSVDLFEDRFNGVTATTDLEVLFQLIHLGMTTPRVDPVALDQYLDDQLPYAENPGLDSGYAEFVAMQDARYDDIRFLAPTPETLATVSADGLARVAADRFGDASDWTFSFSGDFDVDAAIELARSYLGTLPSSGRVEEVGFDEEPPPSGVVLVETQAGEGETANVSFLFTAEASTDRRDDVLARVVQEVVSNRLTDFIREELGDTYSPFGQLSIGSGATPPAEYYISVSTAPDLVEKVSSAVLSQLADLRDNGPASREFDNAIATVGEQLNFFNNGQINDEVLDALVDPAGSADFDDFLYELDLIPSISASDVQSALQSWTSPDQYIEVRVLPRS